MFVVGIFVLIKTSKSAISNAIKFSKLVHLSEMVVGFILLAIATSLPELTISLISALEGSPQLGISNILGANITNITLVFASFGLIGTFTISIKDYEWIKKILFSTSIIALFAFLLGSSSLIFGLFCIIMFYLMSKISIKEFEVGAAESELPIAEALKSFVLILINIALVIISAKLVTDSALYFSQFINIAFVGGVIVSIGTTLPELTVSIAAIKSFDFRLALGNILGTLTANIMLVFGLSSIITPMIFSDAMKFMMIYLIAVNIIFINLIKNGTFGIKQTLMLYIMYGIFLFSVLFIG